MMLKMYNKVGHAEILPFSIQPSLPNNYTRK